MPWTFPSGVPIKRDENGRLLGGTYTPPGEDPLQGTVQGDPEAAKQVANALGLPGIAQMIDKAASGENPFSSNVSLLPEGVSIPGDISAVAGDLGGQISGLAGSLPGLAAGAIGNAASSAQAQLGDYISGSIDAAAGQAIAGVLSGGGGAAPVGPLPLDNELEVFASMNCLWGLGCISPQELNFPDRTYRKNGVKYGQRILKSGGTPIGKPRTYAEKTYGIDTGYYIDNVNIDTVIAPNARSRQTNFYNLTFSVFEPFSMGQFLQTCQIAAKNAGYDQYLEAPFLLTLEFVGYDSEGNIANTRPIRKMFPVKLVSINFNVDNEGSRYDISCSVFNDEALLDANQSIPVNITVSGRTLQETCQTGLNSIATHINTHLLNARNETREKTEVDEYIIAFPSNGASDRLDTLIHTFSGENTATSGELQYREFDEDAINQAFSTVDSTLAASGYEQDNSDFGARIIEQKTEFVEGRLGYSVKRGRLSEGIKATIAGTDVEPNIIGQAPILSQGPLGAGRAPFGVANFAWNPDTGLLQRQGTVIDPSIRTITFQAGTKIQKIIEELVLLSDYGKRLADQLNTSRDGMVDWFRIESQVYLIQDSAAEKVLGRMPRIYLYRVVPYKVHRSVFQMPNDTPPGYDELYKKAAKKYNYMYTGQNKNILKFDLQFDNAFYEAIAVDSGNRSASNNPSEQSTTDIPTPLQVQGSSSAPTGDGRTLVRENVNTGAITSGATTEDPILRLARQFNEAIVNSSGDLISIEMEILGDPYFIADSGVGNYNSRATPMFNVNSDGSINHQSGEVDIIINFRTPVDIDPETGGYKFDGASIGLKDYSGLYKVNEVTNRFSNNMFTQTLQCVRRRNLQTSILSSTETRDRILEEEQRYENRVNEARENGTPEDVAFAIADRNADGVLQYWEVPSQEEAAALNGRQDTGASPNDTPSQSGGTGETATPAPATTENPDANDPRGDQVASPTQPATPATTPATTTSQVGTGTNPNDVYYDYGGGRQE